MAGSDVVVAQTAPPKGYREVSLIGSGATSRVFRAVDEKTGQVVALKRLHRQLVRTTEALTRLRRELQSLASLNHPGITRVHDVIRWGGDPTVVMEYVPGEDLKERIERVGPMPFEDVESIGRSILDILAATHAAGIVHRDLKPQNVRLAPDGKVYLLDFGSARLCAASELTSTGTTVGTPEYMAPELFAGPVYDPRVDIYGVGASLYECLTGRPPQTADSLANLAFMRTQTDVPLVTTLRKDTPPHLARVVDRCLARNPEDRFSSAALATWALDNPELEKAFAARRSSHPPCLHCGAPIPAESTRCSRCRSDHPFQFAPGLAHVVINRVNHAEQFMEQLVTWFPERASPAHLHRLTERVAALSFGKQRFVSFIDEEEARALVTRLGQMDVGAEVVIEERQSSRRALIALNVLTVLAALSAAPGSKWSAIFMGLGLMLPILGVHLVGALSSVWKASHGMLSSSTSSKLVWPEWSQWLGWGTVGGAVVASALTGAAGLMGATASLGTAWLASLGMRMKALPGRSAASPEPSRKEMVNIALFPARYRKTNIEKAQVKKVGKAGQLVVVLCLLGIVPLELYTLLSVDGWVNRVGTAVTKVIKVVQPTPTNPNPNPANPNTTTGGGAVSLPTPERAFDVLIKGTQLVPPLIAVGAMTALMRRRRRVRTDAAELYSELDLQGLRKLGERTHPLARKGEKRLHAAESLLRLEAGDAFIHEAVQRANDLARCLPSESVARISRAIDAMRAGNAQARVAERSLLARCIAETDSSQQARMDFLALEGRLEMEAAAAWVKRVKERK